MDTQTASTESSSPKTYNGWANYETWSVNLWISNDQGLYGEINERARIATRHLDEGETLDSDDVNAFGQELKSFFEESLPTMRLGLWNDLLNAALSEVDWQAIAEAQLEA